MDEGRQLNGRNKEEVPVKNVLWFVLGTGAGFLLAHLVNKDPRGHEVLAEIDARITEFTDRIGEAYREEQAKFSDSDVASVVADRD
ncbi:class I SAM-dependent methyltransferase [Microbacterium sp. cx-55]|uniref:class I SAM-dependent methyltransferase n=1 Tax=unclassified Microbacterium TaxID=2609290 RepID=UPI001CBE3E44|nr:MULTISPECIES: class I SAM-dependent methyltransferase [unclassified Microbacterium]MBZ4486375.1 ATPase [Microbacterium sp. cx-55]MCC4907347.1 class I SAM-dependent methyltransferase [Microbacterium sp. cx-59]UGB33787.1 class I SAM-dependent methyltransferase [Microbacterium sp. cx-55]